MLPSSRALLVVGIALIALWFVNLDSRRLVHPDEGRYAEIAREMAASGDWVTPRLNELKYFEKPPFQYWATAALYRAFGVHEWTARLWPALAGLLGVAAIGSAGYAIGGAPLGVYAALALAGTVWHAGIAQIVSLDSGVSFFLALGFAAFVCAQRDAASAAQRRALMWLTWAALAGATLSKGLIGVALPAGALLVYTLITRDTAVWRRLHLSSGLAGYAVLTAPWFVAVARANEEFARFFFIHEHFERFLTTEHQREGAPWYFVPLLVVGVLPWLTVLGYGLPRAWRDGMPSAHGFSWQRFALVWAAFVFVFFSASGSKLPSYILPLFAPLALVTGWLLLRLEAATLARLVLPLAVVSAVALLVVIVGYDRYAPRFAYSMLPADVLLRYGKWVVAVLVVDLIGASGAYVALRAAARDDLNRFRAVALLAFASLAGVQLAVAGFDTFSRMRSASAILHDARAAAPIAAGAPFYQVRMYDQTVPFYLGRATRVVAYRGELALGIDAEPQKQVPTTADWAAEWRGLAQGYAIMSPDTYRMLAAEGIPMRELAADVRRVVVSRR